MDNEKNKRSEFLSDRKLPGSEEIAKFRNSGKIKTDYSLIKKMMMKKILIWGTTALAVIIGAVTILYKSPAKKDALKEATLIDTTVKYIAPPLKGLDIQYEKFVIKTGEPTTIHTKNGTVLGIPADAFVSEEGSIGDSVVFYYREFFNPCDIFVAGIPMDYDSAGITYNFESAGMIEIKGFSDDKPLALKKGKTVQVSMPSAVDTKDYNLYILDTVQGKWVYVGKDEVLKPNEKKEKTKKSEVPTPNVVSNYNTVAPKLADKNRYKFNISFNKVDFPQLAMYENVLFEVADNTFKPDFYKIRWDNIELTEGKKAEEFVVNLKKADTIIKVCVIPVFEEKDYNTAKKNFDQSYQNYRSSVDKEKADKDTKLEAINKGLKNYNNRMLLNAQSTYRVYNITTLGIWNVDIPTLFAPFVALSDFVKKKIEEQSQEIQYEDIFMAVKGKNTLYKFKKGQNIPIDTKEQNLLWIVDNRANITFLKVKDYQKLIDGDGDITLDMYPDKNKALEIIRKFNI